MALLPPENEVAGGYCFHKRVSFLLFTRGVWYGRAVRILLQCFLVVKIINFLMNRLIQWPSQEWGCGSLEVDGWVLGGVGVWDMCGWVGIRWCGYRVVWVPGGVGVYVRWVLGVSERSSYLGYTPMGRQT